MQELDTMTRWHQTGMGLLALVSARAKYSIAGSMVALLLAPAMLFSAMSWQSPDSAGRGGVSPVVAGPVATMVPTPEGAPSSGDKLFFPASVPLLSSSAQPIPSPVPLQATQSAFSPSAMIQYSIEKAGMVSLSLYNLFGYEIAALVREHQEAGRYSVPLHTNDGSANLTPGVYFYRLDTGAVHTVRKLVLIR